MKKNLFSPSFSLLAFAALLIFASCRDTNEALRAQIRAEVEKEYKQKLEALLQEPKNVLSASDMKIVLAKFKDTKLTLGDTTEIVKLADKTIYFANGKDLNGSMLSYNNGQWSTVLVPGYLPVTAFPDFKDRIIKDFCQYTRCPEPLPGGIFQLDPKWLAIANTIDLRQIYARSADCESLCDGMDCNSIPITSSCWEEKRKCKAKCLMAVLKDIRF